MNARPMPPAEVDVSLGLVRRFIAEQMPDLADRPLRMLARGWDNVMVRLGDHLAARLPRRAVAVDLLLHEQRWLADLAPRLPLPIPAPVRIGRPGPARRHRLAHPTGRL
jgi:aminoglycoside phosphotransferase (APT) family kinase protein